MPMASMHPAYPCPGYLMGPPGPMPGNMAQGFNQGYNHWGSGRGQNKLKKDIHHAESDEIRGRYTKGTPIHIGESEENHGRYTDSFNHEESSNSGEEGPGGSIVVVQPTPAIMSLKATKKKDFVYLYVGVPKNIMKS